MRSAAGASRGRAPAGRSTSSSRARSSAPSTSSAAAEAVAELLGVAPADHQRGDARPPEQPGQRHLRRRHPVRRAHLLQHGDDPPQPVDVADRRLGPARRPAAPTARRARTCRERSPPASGLQTRMPDPLGDRDLHQLVLGLARLERIVDLLGDRPRRTRARRRSPAPSSGARPSSSRRRRSGPCPARPACRPRRGSPRAASTRPTRAGRGCRSRRSAAAPRLASTCRITWCRDSPSPFGPSSDPEAHLRGDQHVARPLAAQHLADDLLRLAAANRRWRCRSGSPRRRGRSRSAPAPP